MTTINNNITFGTAARLLKSADSLDFALAPDAKKGARTGLLDLSPLDTVFGSTDLSATALFDDWLSGDLQQAGFLSQGESSASSSDSDSSTHSPVFSQRNGDDTAGDSPALGFDSIASDADLIRSPNFDVSTMGLFPDIPSIPSSNRQATPATTPMMPLTAESVQQAAAALNIPWSKGLEEAVLAQSLLATFPMALAMPPAGPMGLAGAGLGPAPATMASATAPAIAPAPAPAPAAIAPARHSSASLPPLMPKQGASMTVSHMPDHIMDMSPSRPSLSSLSPMTSTLALHTSLSNNNDISSSNNNCNKNTSGISSNNERALGSPSLSILSSTMKSLPVMAPGGVPTTIKATTYKSTYRSASLLKRDREFDEPPSVLEGRDITEMDEVSLKRAKNTDAARRSRRKKLIKMESLEQRVAELEVENAMFESKLNEVELERSLLADKDQLQQARIQELEAALEALREKMY
ncbi:hypothetical protein BGZ94_009849 [Podila epigama]|nr:hypothetical protein BGZ94_009849 [Podila epigama]